MWGVLANTRRAALPPGALEDSRLRRIGWGLVLAVSRVCALFGAAFGLLAGRQQIVPRAELNGFLELAKRTDGVDFEYVLKRCRRGPGAIHNNHVGMLCQL